MQGKLRQLSVVLLMAGALAGCKTTHPAAPDHPHPPDPLCVSKKPLEGNAQAAEPDAPVRLDPPPPPAPVLPSNPFVRQPAPLGPPQPAPHGLD